MIEFFEHTADAGFRITSPDREGLFQEAGRALFQLIVQNLDEVQPLQKRHLCVKGSADDYLLFDWLDELLYLHATQSLVFCQFEVTLTPHGLSADVSGELLDASRHRLAHEVKAITYHELSVVSTADGWQASVIVDI